jgi:uroporphyrinogen decarboxylase
MNMSNKDHFHSILNRSACRSAFWHGDPNPASVEGVYAHFNVADDFELGLKLGSVFRWVMPEKYGFWHKPGQRDMFDPLGGAERKSLSQEGVLAGCESVREVEAHNWPEIAHCDFSKTIDEIKRTAAAGQAVVSGTWSCFFHNVSDLFGMENYFVKMHTHPDVVIAVTERVVDFYLKANEILLNECEDIDAFFFGNDFGSQLDLLISPEHFDRFIMPYFVKFTEQAHRHGLKAILHSCGSINRVIPRLIDAGVDALHPIQALAAGMDAASLARQYNGKIVFIGGIDTQRLLPFGTPVQIRDEVRRLRDLFGPNYIVSPSHESILPNVPPENIAAMAEAALE